MKRSLVLQLLILLLVVSSDGIFFNHNKKSIWDLFSKEKDRKKPNIHHFHLHYYPLPYKIVDPPLIAPEKRTLETIHEEKFRSLGWTDEEYSVPDPKIIYPSNLESLWKEEQQSPYVWSSNLFESKPPKESSDVLVQVPLHQQIIFQLPKEKEETSILGSLLKKIRNIKKFFFSDKSENDEHGWESRSDKKFSSNDLTDYFNFIKHDQEKDT